MNERVLTSSSAKTESRKNGAKNESLANSLPIASLKGSGVQFSSSVIFS